MSDGVYVIGGMCPQGKCPGGKYPRGICPWGKCPGGTCLGEVCPVTGSVSSIWGAYLALVGVQEAPPTVMLVMSDS